MIMLNLSSALNRTHRKYVLTASIRLPK